MNFLTDDFKFWLKWMGKLLGIVVLLAVGIVLWIRYHTKTVNAPAVLPPNVKGRITYDENKHTLTTTTPAGTKTVYSRNPTVDLQADGNIRINPHAWGLEFSPIIGVGYQDTRRLYLGVNHFYFHQFDVFTAVGLPMDNGHTLIEPITGVSWNLWHNCALNAGVNPVNVVLHEKPEIGLLLSIKL